MLPPKKYDAPDADDHNPHAGVAVTEWKSIHCLIEELSLIQRRIGTPLELPEDLPRVRDLGVDLQGRLVKMTGGE